MLIAPLIVGTGVSAKILFKKLRLLWGEPSWESSEELVNKSDHHSFSISQLITSSWFLKIFFNNIEWSFSYCDHVCNLLWSNSIFNYQWRQQTLQEQSLVAVIEIKMILVAIKFHVSCDHGKRPLSHFFYFERSTDQYFAWWSISMIKCNPPNVDTLIYSSLYSFRHKHVSLDTHAHTHDTQEQRLVTPG